MATSSSVLPTEWAPRGARRIALKLLEDVCRERARLDRPSDEEALHDFRVAVRRLRSWLRSMKGDLADSYPRSVKKALREYGKASNAGRDAEVLLDWLAQAVMELPPRHRGGARWLMRQQQSRERVADKELLSLLGDSFDQVAQRLDRRLQRFRTTVYLDKGPEENTLAQSVALRGHEQGAKLRTLLARVQDVDDDAVIHAARIAGKRLRYLLEPLAVSYPDLQVLVDRLKGLQDTLGSVHDAHVWGAELHQTLQRAADQEGRTLRRMATGLSTDGQRTALPGRPGLMALASLMHVHAAREFERFKGQWIDDGGRTFFADLEMAMETLGRVAPSPPVEIERKYLLRALPRKMPRGRLLELHQGYLPGDRIIERLRKTTRGRSVTYARTIKFGAGVVRTEIEEPVSREFFDQVWPLTEGKRVLKRRHAIKDGKHIWEIDVFTDRDLVLAEVELAEEQERVPFPKWLSRYVVREVTTEAEYVNYHLAK